MTACVSIIMPSYNKAAMIGQTIESVLAQSYTNWELIAVDDASTDGTEKCIKAYCEKDGRIQLVLNKNTKGANHCRNIGIEMSRGTYIIFLDADDLLATDCLMKRVKIMDSNHELNFAVFTMQVFNKSVGDNPHCWKPRKKNALSDFLAHKLPWQTMQPIWKRDFVVKLGGFDVSFQRMQDVELHTRALLRSPNFVCIDGEPDCFYRIDEERKNFSAYIFLERWVDSAVRYCNKFSPLVDVSLLKFLWGTKMAASLQLYYHVRESRITRQEYSELKRKLWEQKLTGSFGWFRLLIFKVSEFYNLWFPRIPGVNWMLTKLIIL
mgnify:CR=1 FL=1